MSDQKTIPCPSCNGQILENKKDKSFLEIMSGILKSPVLILKQIANPPAQSPIVDKKSIYNGKCPDCGGKGTFPDTSDTSKQEKQAAQVAQKNAPAIMAAEASLDTGGFTNSRHISVLGNQVVEIGVGFNKL